MVAGVGSFRLGSGIRQEGWLMNMLQANKNVVDLVINKAVSGLVG